MAASVYRQYNNLTLQEQIYIKSHLSGRCMAALFNGKLKVIKKAAALP